MSSRPASTSSGWRTPTWPRGCWPDETQLLLLKACLLDDPAAALDAWQQWSGRVSLTDLDGGSFKLLPLLWRRLATLGVSQGALPRLLGAVRFQWARSVMLLRELEPALRVLHQEGIPTVLLKGAALHGTAYPRWSRGMDDLDVFVPRTHARAAAAALQRQGWETRHRLSEPLIAVMHSIAFTRDRCELDLHWDLCDGRFLDDESQHDLCQASLPVQVGRETTRVLCPADQLLHTCEHGVRYNSVPPFRWLADAFLVVRAAGDTLDWQRLTRMARCHRMVLPLRETLHYLQRHLGLQLPPAAQALDELRPGTAARLELALAARKPPAGHPFWGALPLHWFHYRRLRAINRRVGLGQFLQLANDLDHSVSQHVRRLLRLKGYAACDSLRRFAQPGRARGEHYVSMYSVHEDDLAGFYPPELHGRTVFRWTHPVAAITLPLRRGTFEISLQLAPVRAWFDDLCHTLAIDINRCQVPRETWRFEDWRIRFVVGPEMLAGQDRQRLELRCPAWKVAHADPRSLGIPLIGIHYRASCCPGGYRVMGATATSSSGPTPKSVPG